MDIFSNNKQEFKLVEDVVKFVLVIGSALMMWNVGKIVTNTESPIVVVLTGSMEPAFFRGDLLFVTHFKEDLVAGDIIVYKIPNQEIPIVHRAMVIQIDQKPAKQKKTEKFVGVQILDDFQDYLTRSPFDEDFVLLSKGDNNMVDDRGLYPRGVAWLNRKHIIGKIRGYCPYIGYFTILISDYPILKYMVLGLMLLSVVLSKEDEF